MDWRANGICSVVASEWWWGQRGQWLMCWWVTKSEKRFQRGWRSFPRNKVFTQIKRSNSVSETCPFVCNVNHLIWRGNIIPWLMYLNDFFLLKVPTASHAPFSRTISYNGEKLFWNAVFFMWSYEMRSFAFSLIQPTKDSVCNAVSLCAQIFSRSVQIVAVIWHCR